MSKPVRYSDKIKYTWWKDRRKANKGWTLLSVKLGYWWELKKWPVPGRIFRWNGRIPDTFYYFKCWLFKRYNTVTANNCPPTWQDRCGLLLDIMFTVLIDVVEKEDWLNARAYFIDGDEDGVRWDAREEWQEVATLYDWWVHKRPARIAEEDRALTEWHDYAYSIGSFKTEPTEEGFSRLVFKHDDKERDLNAYMRKLEADAEAEDQAMMIRLVNIREYLWT